MCNFCGGEGDSELCKEKDNTCFYLSDGALEISESCGYCSLMATSPKKCENAKGCDIDGYLSGKPEDSIFAGAYELRAVVDSYNKFVESEAKELPAYNIYWATALGYNAGVGSMKYSRFITYNIFGGISWILLFLFGGFFFGNITIVKENFTLVILAIIIISFIPAIVEYIKHKINRN